VVSVPIPSEAAQLAFLRNVQRLLEEGQFTATYKFALLGILEQAQAHAATLADLRRNPKWEPLLKQLARQVELMPLLKLQTLRGDRKLLFLYQEEVKEGAIELLPGVAFCLRRFSGFLRTLAQHGWLNEIRRNSKNAYLVGSGESLEEFLFGDDRVPLGVVREILWPMQDGRCFYCGERMNAGLHVDHFVPFVLHPANLGHYGRARESEAALWMRRGETRPFPRGATLSI